MATIKYKPTTPARRNMSVPDFAEITKFAPEKSLIETKKKHAGRNSYGKITVRHHGGGISHADPAHGRQDDLHRRASRHRAGGGDHQGGSGP